MPECQFCHIEREQLSNGDHPSWKWVDPKTKRQTILNTVPFDAAVCQDCGGVWAETDKKVLLADSDEDNQARKAYLEAHGSDTERDVEEAEPLTPHFEFFKLAKGGDITHQWNIGKAKYLQIAVQAALHANFDMESAAAIIDPASKLDEHVALMQHGGNTLQMLTIEGTHGGHSVFLKFGGYEQVEAQLLWWE